MRTFGSFLVAFLFAGIWIFYNLFKYETGKVELKKKSRYFLVCKLHVHVAVHEFM